jgi:5-methylcytosine-specific restriction endonuclease McrA
MAAARKKAIEYYPYLSEWPHNLGPAPSNDDLEQAFALLLAVDKHPRRADGTGTREALAVAGYLSSSPWDRDELGEAVARATRWHKTNDWYNVIRHKGEGLDERGYVTLDEQPDGRWSITLKAKGEVAVAKYCADEGIENLVAAAREQQANRLGHLMDQVELMQGSLEGRKLLRRHLIRERDPDLVRRFKKRLSLFSCTVCNFDFEHVYGPIGREFIEAHHVEPIGFRDGGTPTSIDDLIAVCSNCHRMIHRHAPPYTADEIKAFMHRP